MAKMAQTAEQKMDKACRTIIAGRMEEMDWINEDLAKSLKTSRQTVGNKRKEPGKITLNELRAMIRVLHISDAEIIRMVRA